MVCNQKMSCKQFKLQAIILNLRIHFGRRGLNSHQTVRLNNTSGPFYPHKTKVHTGDTLTRRSTLQKRNLSFPPAPSRGMKWIKSCRWTLLHLLHSMQNEASTATWWQNEHMDAAQRRTAVTKTLSKIHLLLQKQADFFKNQTSLRAESDESFLQPLRGTILIKSFLMCVVYHTLSQMWFCSDHHHITTNYILSNLIQQ